MVQDMLFIGPAVLYIASTAIDTGCICRGSDVVQNMS